MSKKTFEEPELLVIIQEPSDVMEQEILERAFEYNTIPYSAPGYDNAYIFKGCDTDSLLKLSEQLSNDDDLPIKIIPSSCLRKALS